jgi:magnesium-transporting ATPase (P-type)
LCQVKLLGNDYSKDRQFKKLSAINQNKKVEVIRKGKVDVISNQDLLVGDVVLLHTGDAIPADGIFVSGDGITIDGTSIKPFFCSLNAESSLTGEPRPCRKSTDRPFFLSGCTVSIFFLWDSFSRKINNINFMKVAEGVGKMVVVCTGMNSEFGSLKAMIEQEHENTPLQDTLENMADFIGWCGVTAAVLTFLALLFKVCAFFRFTEIHILIFFFFSELRSFALPTFS